MLLNLKHWLLTKFPHAPGLEPTTLDYLSNSYPNNHNYTLRYDTLVPYPQLAKRAHTLSQLYPAPLTSLLDLSACKGYFVFNAAKMPTCQRAAGIDLYEPYIDVCNRVKDYLELENTQFAKLSLAELANQHLNNFGGPFQTVLLVNTYQYLYFGSDLVPDCYLDHDKIFADIRKVCASHLIFNNRTELKNCQNQAQIAHAPEQAQHYTTEKILAAASKYFTIKAESQLGRYPLWLFVAR